MFVRTSAITMLAFPFLAAATVITRTTTPTTPASQCNTGDLQCCNSTVESSEAAELLQGAILGIIQMDWSSLTGVIGLTCSPLTVGGGGSSSCATKPVCCSNNNFHGAVAINCTPVNLNL